MNRILMTADTIGGVWTYALELCRGLAEHGIEVALATMGALPRDSQRAEVKSLPNVELYTSTFRLEWMQEPWEDVARAGRWLLKLEERVCPDIIHLNTFPHSTLPWLAPVLVVGHSCVLSWWRAVKKCEAPPAWDMYRDVVATSLRAAQVVVAPSLAMMESLLQDYGPFRSRVVIPNGRTAINTSTHLKEPIILAAGRLWDEAKNMVALASTAQRLLWPVYLAGDQICLDGKGEPQSKNSDFSRHNVRSLGRLSPAELQLWYKRAAIYALPARYEPFGLTALEAALAGCALVLGDIPSLREIWGDAALFVNPDKPEELARALQSLIDSPDHLQRLASRSSSVARKYKIQKMVSGYLAAYSQLLETRPQLPPEDADTAPARSSSLLEKGAFACTS